MHIFQGEKRTNIICYWQSKDVESGQERQQARLTWRVTSQACSPQYLTDILSMEHCDNTPVCSSHPHPVHFSLILSFRQSRLFLVTLLYFSLNFRSHQDVSRTALVAQAELLYMQYFYCYTSWVHEIAQAHHVLLPWHLFHLFKMETQLQRGICSFNFKGCSSAHSFTCK